MIFVVQTCPPRDPSPVVAELIRQRDERGNGILGSDVVIGVESDTERRGQLPTMLAALGRYLSYPGGGGRDAVRRPVTLVEDDVELCADFVSYVFHHWREPAVPVVSWYTHPWLVKPEGPLVPWWVYPGEPFVGTQAVTFAPEFIAEFLASPLVVPFAQQHRHDGDQLVGLELRRAGYRYAVRIPGGAQHLGADSLVMPPDPNPQRRTGQPIRFYAKHYVGRTGRMGG